MTLHQQTLLLRLAAAEVSSEARSSFVLRRMLRDLGMTDLEMIAAVEALRQAVATVVLSQAQLFDRAA